jgi:dethiobiotin synthetase
MAGDLDEVRRLAGVTDLHEFARYAAALAPATAARLAGLPPPDLAACAEQIASLGRDLVIVEGAGGLLVRYDDEGATLADLAHALGAPMLVTVRSGLGTLNHTALTLEAMAGRGVELAGIVIWTTCATSATWRPSRHVRSPGCCPNARGGCTARSSCSPPATVSRRTSAESSTRRGSGRIAMPVRRRTGN